MTASSLAITNNTITLGSTIYQIRNITSVSKYKLKPVYYFNAILLFLFGFLAWVGYELAKAYPDVSGYKWLAFISILLLASGIFERVSKAHRYGLALETSSGGARLISSEDQVLIDSIISRIIDVMNNKDKPANYTFNIPKGDIINQSGIFQNGVRLG